jgi:hypothetical protein
LAISIQHSLDFLHRCLLIERRIVCTDFVDRHIAKSIPGVFYHLRVSFIDDPNGAGVGIVEGNPNFSLLENFLVIDSRHTGYFVSLVV